MNNFKLRPAKITELSRLVYIDDRASELFCTVGMKFNFEASHPFVIAEVERWKNAIHHGNAIFVVDPLDNPVGFSIVNIVDNCHYLDQISVHPDFMGMGLGKKLLLASIDWSQKNALWLTTYSHVKWNAPWYKKLGFKEVLFSQCSPGIQKILLAQQEVLPDPEKRIAMVRQ